MKSSDTNLTVGNPMAVIIKFALPLFLGNVFMQFYNLADSMIVGRFVGPDAFGAVVSTGSIMFLINGLANGMATGFTILTSQKYGLGDKVGVKKTVVSGAILTVLISLSISIIGSLFMRNILHIMKSPEELIDYSYKYISVIAMGLPAATLYNYCSSLLRSVGNSKMPLVSLIIASFVNIGLDLTFIIVFDLGVAGAALATVLSQIISIVIQVVYIYKRMEVLVPDKETLKPDMCYVKKQLILGVPMGLQYAITASGAMIMQTGINSFGHLAVDGTAAATKVNNIMTQGMFTMGQVMASYVGQNFGMGNIKRVKEGIKAANIIMICYCLITAVLAVILLKPLMPIFLSGVPSIEPYLPWARTYIYIAACLYIFLGMVFIYRNSIQALGFSVRAMLLGISEFVSRCIISSLAIVTSSFFLACLSDCFAWVCAGTIGLFMARKIIKKLEVTSTITKA